MNSITAIIVCDTANRATAVENAFNNYAIRTAQITDAPITQRAPTGKYGAGPTVIGMAWFGPSYEELSAAPDQAARDVLEANGRTMANDAWTTLMAQGTAWVQAGTYLIQMDGETVVHHEMWDPTRRVIV